MKFTRIIADSGGTKTDWYGINENHQTHTFTTESYHPINVDEEFTNRQVEFWKQHDISECFLHFFGSGCLREENQQKMQSVFQKIGFSDILVESDLFAAARAVNNEEGMTAICGTGSVLFKIEHDQLIELRGGLGWEQGDEGGGFYFGKLLLERLEENKNKYPEIRAHIEKWKRFEELSALRNKPESKNIYSQLPLVLSEYKANPLVSSVHLENIHLFLELYANDCNSIGFVGSYAFHMQDFFSFACNQRNIDVFSFVERPIELLAKDLLL